MKRLAAILMGLALLFSGCGQKETRVPNRLDKPASGGIVYEQSHEGEAINPISGLYIDEEAAMRRPIAVMINNAQRALPQSGISQADVIYEALAEGGVTRFLAVFQDFDAEKIGPVRSAREYFTDFVLDLDAVYVHHGGSPSGYIAIRYRGLAHLDGMTDSAFWRDEARMQQEGMYEHSSYTNAEKIRKDIEAHGYRVNHDTSYLSMFTFCEEDTELLYGEAVTHIVLPYSDSQESEFIYNERTKLYERYQNGKPQIDVETGKVLTAKNIIIQYAKTYEIPEDEEGRLIMEVVSSGEGVYITDGRMEPIEWVKTAHHTQTEWMRKGGGTLLLNPGTTWICVYPTNQEVILEGEEEP